MKNQEQKTILLVEDEGVTMMVETLLLKSFGYDVVTAKSGEEAVQIATGNDKIDLILMDINLGSGIDGTEAARQILGERHLPIVFLTSHSEKEYVERVKAITRYGYVMKNSDEFVIQSSIEMAFELFEVVRMLQKNEKQNAFQTELLWNVPVIAAFHDLQLNVVWANKAYEEATGLSVQEMAGKKCYSVWGLTKACRNCPVVKAIESGEPGEAELTPQKQDHLPESQGYWLSRAAPVRDADGRVLGAIETAIDITEHKLAQEKLLVSERLAVMGRLVADVSHEISNPLMVIVGETEFMLSQLDKKTSPFKKQLETVLRSAKRCQTIFANLLSYNRTIGKKEEAINLPDLIREAIGDVNYQYDMSGIETVLNCNEIANAKITGNSTALLSVFVNLIRNARQAMGEKGCLTITTEKEDKKHLRIEIHDTGIGMSAKQKAELFKPFASGWKETTSAQKALSGHLSGDVDEGSGLGLATSLGIIETHGGSLSAKSEGVGKGATFTILLPCEFKDKKQSENLVPEK